MPAAQRSATRPESAEAGEASPDAAIASAIGSGDHRQALVLCSRHHGAAIGRLCMAMLGSQANAEDIVQETLLDAHDGFASWRGEGSIRAWLFGIARRKCARQLERQARQRATLRQVPSEQPPPESGVEERVLRGQRAVLARAALGRIRPSEREALLLRYGAELSYRELAQACGIEQAAARKRVSRALGALRQLLDGTDDDHLH